ncbi:MAG: hypothetical protein ABF242_01830, partial [Flavobacteriales bacterium]
MRPVIQLLIFLLPFYSFTQLTSSVKEQCYFNIELIDDYGDGWDGAEVEILDSAGNLVYTLGSNFLDSTNYTENVLLNSGDLYSIVVSDTGSYPGEIGLIVYSNGSVISNYIPSTSTALNTQMATFRQSCSNCAGTQMCLFEINLTDSYGDGWAGEKIEIQDFSGNVFYVLGTNFTAGSSYTDSLYLCHGKQYKAVVTQLGDYPEEIGLTISSDGSTVLSYSPSTTTRVGVRMGTFVADCKGSVEVITNCGPFLWRNGNTYTSSASGIKDTIANNAGQDSVLTLHLTINATSSSVDQVTSYGAFTWINGVTYTQNNNTATDTVLGNSGCDSIVTLDLTVQTAGTNASNGQRIASREIMFMPDEEKLELTSKPQFTDSIWANTRIFELNKLVDAYTNYHDDASTPVGVGQYRLLNATVKEYKDVTVWGRFQSSSDTVLIDRFDLLRSFESLIVSFPFGSGNQTFTTKNNTAVTISNPAGKSIELFVSCDDPTFQKLKDITIDLKAWFLWNERSTGNFGDVTPAFCRHFLTAYANIGYMWSSPEFEQAFDKVDMVMHGNTWEPAYLLTADGYYLKTDINTDPTKVKADTFIQLTGDTLLTLASSGFILMDTVSQDTLFNSSGVPKKIQNKFLEGSSIPLRDSFPGSVLLKLLPLSDSIPKATVLNQARTKPSQYLGRISETAGVQGLGGGGLLSLQGGQMYSRRSYESPGSAGTTFFHEFGHGIGYSHNSNLTYPDEFGGWTEFNQKMFQIFSGFTDTVDLEFTDGLPRVLTKRFPFIGRFYLQDIVYTPKIEETRNVGIDSVFNLTIGNIHELLNLSTFETDARIKKLNLVIDSIKLPSQITSNTQFPVSIPVGDSLVFPVNLSYANYSRTDTITISDTITIYGEHTLHIPVNLTLHPVDYERIDSVVSCDSYRWPVNDSVFTQSTFYIDSFVNSSGQDSLIVLDLKINSSEIDTQNVRVFCENYVWPLTGDTLIMTGQYTELLQNKFGCDSLIVLNLFVANSTDTAYVVNRSDDAKEFVLDSSVNTGSNLLQIGSSSSKMLKTGIRFETVNIPKGSTVVNASISFTASGTSADPLNMFIVGENADSSLTFTSQLYDISNRPISNNKVSWNNVEPWESDSVYSTPDVTAIIQEIIDKPGWETGNPITFIMWSQDSTTSDDRTIKSKDKNGILQLNFDYSTDIQETDTCGDSYFWSVANRTFYQSGEYLFKPSNNCADIKKLRLNLYPIDTVTDVVVSADPLRWIDGNTYSSSNFSASFDTTNANGCDSTIQLFYLRTALPYGVDSVETCDSLTWINGQTYSSNTSQVFDTVQRIDGSDSLVQLYLTIYRSTENTQNISTCNDSYTWINGQTYTEENNTATFLYTSVNGCDSILKLNLAFLENSEVIDTVFACDSHTWVNGVTYYQNNNSATVTLTNRFDCDSVVTLDLRIQGNSSRYTDVVTACESLTWIDGVTYTSSNNTATYTTVNSVGCDSIITLNLTVTNLNDSVIDSVTGCNQYTWIDGTTYTTDNSTATVSLTNRHGCDSVIRLNLHLSSSLDTIFRKELCEYYWNILGDTLTTPGFYKKTYINSAGCDSTFVLGLTLINGVDTASVSNNSDDVKEFILSSSVNTGSRALQLGADGSNLVKTGLRFSSVDVPQGSKVTSAHIIVEARANDNSFLKMNIAAEDTDSSSTFSSASGYLSSLTLTNQNSIWVMPQFVKNTLYSSTDISNVINEVIQRPNWKSGNAISLIMWSIDSSLTNRRTIKSYGDNYFSSLVVEYSGKMDTVVLEDSSFTWPVNQLSYDSSGIYRSNLVGNDCGEARYLNLTLTSNTGTPTYSSVSVNSCEDYTWSQTGLTYTGSGAYRDTLTNSSGNDSIITLNLTINNSTTGTDVQTACNSFTWIDGVTYTSSNNSAKDTLTNAAGCDSV